MRKLGVVLVTFSAICAACEFPLPDDLGGGKQADGVEACLKWNPCPSGSAKTFDAVGNPYCEPSPPPPPSPSACAPGMFELVVAGGTKCVAVCPPSMVPTPAPAGPRCSEGPKPVTCPPGLQPHPDPAGTVVCVPEPPPPPPPPPFACPPPSVYSTNGEGLGFCLVNGMRLPQDPAPYCHWISKGYIGFTWPEDSNVGYECPAGLVKSTNLEGLGFCLLQIPDLPPTEASAYCDYLASGTIGFHWLLQ